MGLRFRVQGNSGALALKHEISQEPCSIHMWATRKPGQHSKLRLMDKILHDPKDPKLWELWYIPYTGSCRILSINRRAPLYPGISRCATLIEGPQHGAPVRLTSLPAKDSTSKLNIAAEALQSVVFAPETLDTRVFWSTVRVCQHV